MDASSVDLRRIAATLGYGLLGLVGTAAIALGALLLLQRFVGLQRALYHATYLLIGPSEATEFAIVVHFVAAGAVGLLASALAAGYLSDRREHARPLGMAVAAVLGLAGLLLVLLLAWNASPILALGWVAAVAVAVPLLLRVHFGVRSGATPAVLGAVPVLVLLFLLASFGLGWGWGYVVTAEEVPASAVEGEAASFEGAPDFRSALLDPGNCTGDGPGDRRCRLNLRGSEIELAAARFMDGHGVRCPYQGGAGGEAGWFYAEHDGRFYRVTCGAYGD